MILYSKKNSIVLLVFCIAILPVFAQQDLLNYENSLKFARYLTNTGQYSFAAQEYERMNFLWPDDTTVILELVAAYRLNHDCLQFPYSYQLISTNNQINENTAFAREYLRFCLTCKIEHPLYFQVTSMLDPDEQTFYNLGYFWANQQYDSAFQYNHKNKDIISRSHAQLYDLTLDFEKEKYKNPILALAMSAIIPGSGKAYSKRWGDAAISFIFVTTSAYASYRAFSKKGISSLNGWIFGGISISFYASNLYGSFKSARWYNKDRRIQYQNHAESILYNSF